jgi:hypothetical protein
MNIEGTVLTMTMIFAGLIGSGILGVITSGSSNASAISQLKPNIAIMVQFITPISAFAGILSIGVISGGIPYTLTYLQRAPYNKKRYNG